MANSHPTSLVTEGFARALPNEQLAPLPKLVYVELADYCNLSCTFCQRSTYVDSVGRGGFIEFDMLKKLEQPLRAAKYFGLSGRIGEPLLHPKLESILYWLYEINPAILLRITTNGTALSRKLAGLFAGHLDSLSISLNASNAQTYFRDMRPVGQRGDPVAWWDNLIRRISEFIAALPAADRGRVRVMAPVQRDNLDDMASFVQLVASMGCSNATITVMQFHDDTNFGASVFWIKDRYNDVIDQISALGAELGVNVQAAKFYDNPKPEKLDLEALCREPLESAYLNMERLGTTAPCCHWSEEPMPMDVYSDSGAFERFWNSDTYQRLRIKRDFQSCKSCGMSRAFDEMSFHLTSSMKYILAVTNGPAIEEAQEDLYPDSELVRVCKSLSLDLPSLRRTVLKLGVPVDDLYYIKRDGLKALREIDLACWDAFVAADPPSMEKVDIELGGCFEGIGWAYPDNDPVAKVSARWMGGARTASVFVRVVPGYPYRLVVTAHHLRSPEMASGLNLKACGQPLEVQRSLRDDGLAVLTTEIPKELSMSHDGCLWLAIGYNDAHGHEGWVSFSRLEAIKVDEGASG